MDQAYLRALFADEIELAGLLNYRGAHMPDGALTIASRVYPEGEPSRALPQWRRSWCDAGGLLGHHGLGILQNEHEGWVIVSSRHELHSTMERYRDHPDQQFALRAAIVRTLIAYLKVQRARPLPKFETAWSQ
jgi:hypothetical protein